jgi:ribonuclease-3
MTLDKAERWLDKMLHYRFSDPGLFGQALTHRSVTGKNNERLEFLGDAVLDLVISEEICRMRPDASEGDLTRLRAALVKDSSLASLATDLGLGDHLILASGERKTGGHRRQSILADALEAIFGAVYIDGGFAKAKEVVGQVFAERLQSLPDVDDLRDPKTRLQEWLQARKMDLPAYELVDVSGADHAQRFVASCTVDALSQTTEGEASSRRKAEQKAAVAMLQVLLGERP